MACHIHRVPGIIRMHCGIFNKNHTYKILFQENIHLIVRSNKMIVSNISLTATQTCCNKIPTIKSVTHFIQNQHTRTLFSVSSKYVYQFNKKTCFLRNMIPTYCQQRYFSVQQSKLQKIKAPMPTLAVKRPRKKSTDNIEQTGIREVIAYATAEEYDLDALKNGLKTQGLYNITNLPFDMSDVIHVTAKYPVNEEMREIFFLREGSVVFWEVPEREVIILKHPVREEVLKFVKKHGDESYEVSLVYKEHERLQFKLTPNNSTLLKGVINLNEADREGHMVLEKYAFSHALSQSVQLAMWEAALEEIVVETEDLVKDLRQGKTVKLSRRETLQKLGEIFELRHTLNLSSDLLDTPDFYWDRENLEMLYQKCCSYLNISRRTKVMNEKLNYCCELLELVKEQLNDKHHVNLEWMIIILILIEVVFEVLRLWRKD